MPLRRWTCRPCRARVARAHRGSRSSRPGAPAARAHGAGVEGRHPGMGRADRELAAARPGGRAGRSALVHGSAGQQARAARPEDGRDQGVSREDSRIGAARPRRGQGRQHLVYGEFQGVHREARSAHGRREGVPDAGSAGSRSSQPGLRPRRDALLHRSGEQLRGKTRSEERQGDGQRSPDAARPSLRNHRRPGGAAYFCEFGSNKIGRINPATLEILEYTLPDGARPRRIANNPDHSIYYSDFARGYIARFDPRTGKVVEWPSPGGPDSHPYGIASTRDGTVWYSESGVKPNTLVAFNPATKAFQKWPIPSGGGVVRNMVATPDGRLYLACSGVNKIAVAEVTR